ncbi:putative oxidoreductase CipA-like protein [Hypoxylon cercidicola]|nr:putative oxidoreductase CipA-like protein [Hypoxylon cercidicola]
MSTINTVAVAGASGFLGPAIVNQLVEDGFKVTVLGRKGTSHAFPASVATAEIDYESPESLVKALTGQDAVVSTIGFAGLPQQLPLVRAAVAAGVKRFVPSEYGSDATNEAAAGLPPFKPKHAVAAALAAAAAGGDITYTLVSTGPFLDMALAQGLLLDLRGKRARLFDGGDARFSTTTVASVARAVSGVLQHPAETANRNVRVRSASTTQNALLAMAQKAVGADGWTTAVVSTADALAKAYAALAKGEVDRLGFIAAAVWGEGYGGDFEAADNDLLGVHELDDAELQSLVDDIAKK